jgi:hypothetical protein
MDNFKFVLQYECRMRETRTEMFSSRELLDKFARGNAVYRVLGIWEIGKKIL